MKIILKENIPANKRILKIYQKFIKKDARFVPIPEIRLQGKWLQKIGFNCGENVLVIQNENRIIITNRERITVIL